MEKYSQYIKIARNFRRGDHENCRDECHDWRTDWLRERIQAHRAYLEGNETRTRQALIDPMLRALGWEVEDPNSVGLEYEIERKWADYALMESGRPIAVIEAKTLGKALKDDEKMQVLNYANTAGIDYMAVTNGDHWEMFDVFERGRLDDRILMSFQLTQHEPYACALQALRLWRPNLASGKPQEAATPVLTEKATRAGSLTNQSEPATPLPSSTVPSSEQETVELSNNGDWVPLTSLKIERGQKPPAYIKFPNANEKQLKYWANLLENVAKHLVETGKLSARDCPVRKEKSKLYLVHTEPTHSNGKEFVGKRPIGKLWLTTNFNSMNTHNHACWLLNEFGIDPSTVLVSTNQS